MTSLKESEFVTTVSTRCLKCREVFGAILIPTQDTLRVKNMLNETDTTPLCKTCLSKFIDHYTKDWDIGGVIER